MPDKTVDSAKITADSAPVSGRVALGIEYDGSDFYGWQRQPQRHDQNAPPRTVQGCLEQALTRIAANPVSVICAGRTDAGVHASGQVIHFDSPVTRPLRAWTLGVNTLLPPDLSVRWARPVTDDFHARFSATARRYRYVLLNQSGRSALQQRFAALYYRRRLDAKAMHLAGQLLLGENDFSAFRAAGCQSRSPWRNLHELSVIRRGNKIIVEVEANAFLHHMVRNIVGALLLVGAGEQPVSWLTELLASRDRRRGGVTAPPQGLMLVAVRYPTEFAIK